MGRKLAEDNDSFRRRDKEMVKMASIQSLKRHKEI